MSRGLDYGYSYDNGQYGWNTASPQYVHRDPVIAYDAYDVPWSPSGHSVYDENRVVFEEERPVRHVVFEEHYSVPVHKANHHHGSTAGPRKQVHFAEHKEKATESYDSFGNRKVHKESVDSEADGFIKLKHKNFESSKTGSFSSFY